jgi:hypothetical protein
MWRFLSRENFLVPAGNKSLFLGRSPSSLVSIAPTLIRLLYLHIMLFADVISGGSIVTMFTGFLQLICYHANDSALILTDAINTLPWLHSGKFCDRLHNTSLNGHLVALVTISY